MIFRLRLFEFVIHRLDHARGKFLGRQAIATTHDDRHVPKLAFATTKLAGDGGEHIFIERFAIGPRFLGAIQHRDLLRRGGQACQQQLRCKRAIQTHLDQANLLALALQVFDGFLGRLGTGAHQDHYAFGLRIADVVKQMVCTTA